MKFGCVYFILGLVFNFCIFWKRFLLLFIENIVILVLIMVFLIVIYCILVKVFIIIIFLEDLRFILVGLNLMISLFDIYSWFFYKVYLFIIFGIDGEIYWVNVGIY